MSTDPIREAAQALIEQIDDEVEMYSLHLNQRIEALRSALSSPAQEPVAPTPEPVARKPILYVPRATADGDTFIKGELYLSEVSETPFDVRDRDNFECVALYDHPAVDLQALLWARDSLAACNMPTTRIDAVLASPPKGATQDAGEPPQVPTAIINAIQRYGDHRADGDVSAGAECLAAAIDMMRRELGAYATQDAEPADRGFHIPVTLPDGRIAKMRKCDLRDDDLVTFIDSANLPPHSAQEALNARSPWISVEEQPIPRDGGTFLVANAQGAVVPYIRGVIHNNVGSPWDWNYGEAITHWMPLPAPPADSAIASSPVPKGETP